ncbi:Hypothetical predicted protein, partial [Paramuricea clavata]
SQKNAERIKEIVETRHVHKLAKLGATNSSDYIDKGRWVVNLSGHQLTPAETRVLRYGFNFAPAPKATPVPKIVASIESGIRDLPESNKESVRATVTNILKYSKPPTTCNLSRQQKLALKNLREDITIIPADKGKAIVVMDKDDYTSISDLLSDKETYLKITDRRRRPVSKVENSPTLRRHPQNMILINLKCINTFTCISSPLMAHQQDSTDCLKSTNLPYHFATLQVALISRHTNSRNTLSKY